jgi:hypothetical protein
MDVEATMAFNSKINGIAHGVDIDGALARSCVTRAASWHKIHAAVYFPGRIPRLS